MSEKEQAEQRAHYEDFLLEQSLVQLETLTHPQNLPSATLHENALYESSRIVARELGLAFQWIPNQELNREVSFEEQIHQLCLHSQIYYRRVKLDEEWWTTLDFPFVGFYGEERQPVALISRFTKGYQLIDPKTKQTIKVDSTVAAQVSPEGYIFYRALPEDKFSMRNLWNFCIHYRKREWLVFLFLALCSLLFSLFIPFITSFIFDQVIPNRNSDLLVQVVLGTLLLIATTLIFNFNRESLTLRLIGLIDQDLELAVWQRMMNLPVQFFRKYSLYDLFTFSTAISSIRQLVTSQVIMVFVTACFAPIFIALLFYYGPSLAVVGLAILAVEFLVMLLFIPFMIRYGKKMIEREIDSSNKTFETIQAISKIRLAGAEVRFFHRWEQSFANLKLTELKMLLLKMKMSVFNVFSSSAGMGILYLFVILLIASQRTSFVFVNQALSIGNFMAFMTLFVFLSSSLHQIMITLMNLSVVAPLWERIRAFSTAETENFHTKASPGLLQGGIRVDRAVFGYQSDMPPVIQEVSFEIPPGTSAAFVGLSGCGKSTLLRLLLGFESPQQGSIYYDHKDIKGLNLQILRSQLGVCLQTGAILDGTILENINTGRHFTETEVAEAIFLAGMEPFIQQLPMGMETVLTNGGLALSGGQRQMILLARALVGKPKIVILDEATSSIDSQKQEEIHRNLGQLSLTRVIVTQRLDLLRSGIDTIFVMDQGKIVNQGSYAELKEKSELFAQLLSRTTAAEKKT